MLYIQSIVVYTLLALLMCLGAYYSKRDVPMAKLWGWMPIVLFTLVFGLRYGVGVDYNNYVEIYEETASYNSFFSMWENERYEAGFIILLYVCHLVHAPVFVLFSIIAFIQIFLLYKAFKDEGDILVFLYATFIFTGFCMFSFMNIMRHEIAFCIFMYSLRYIRDNKPAKYWLCCLFAFAFHRSAILLFPLYFIWRRRKGIFNSWYIELAAVLGCFLVSFVLSWQNLLHYFDTIVTLLGYENYLEIAEDMTVNSKLGITRLLNLFVTCIIILNSKWIKSYYNSALFNILYDLYIVGVCLGYIFMGSMMFQRIILYASHTHFIVLAYALCYFYKTREKNSAQMLRYAVLALFIVVSYSSFIFHVKDNTGAYVSYFQKDMHKVKDNLRDSALPDSK